MSALFLVDGNLRNAYVWWRLGREEPMTPLAMTVYGFELDLLFMLSGIAAYTAVSIYRWWVGADPL